MNDDKDMQLKEVYRMAYNSLSEDEKDSIYAECGRDNFENAADRGELSENEMVTVYADNKKKQLVKVCNVLGIHFEEFDVLKTNQPKVAYGKIPQRIPVILAPLLIAILRSSSKRESYISRIANKNFGNITLKQKKDFIKIYNEELIKAKEYSDITDVTINEIINSLNSKAEQAEQVNTFINLIDEGILQTIKRDIYNINKVDIFSGIAIPNLRWIKDFINEYKSLNTVVEIKAPLNNCQYKDVMECKYTFCKERNLCNTSEECKKCDYQEMCNKCTDYEKCKSVYKTNELLDSIGIYEKDFFTDIYIGMMSMARQRFFEFIAEYDEVIAELLYDSSFDDVKLFNSNADSYTKQDDKMIKELIYDEEMVKKCIEKVLYESDYEKYIFSRALNNLSTKGISKNKTDGENINGNVEKILKEKGILR